MRRYTSEDKQQASLADLLDKAHMMNSEWYTQQELLELLKQIAARDQNVYRSFVGKLSEVEPGLTNLFGPGTTK